VAYEQAQEGATCLFPERGTPRGTPAWGPARPAVSAGDCPAKKLFLGMF